MKILVIGGTRLLGLALVRALVAGGHSVTVVSRRAENCPEGVECLTGDRQEGLRKLGGRKFDATFDFIAYDSLAPQQVFAGGSLRHLCLDFFHMDGTNEPRHDCGPP